MFLIVGLGNYGLDYELTRHNFGFILTDEINQEYSFDYFGKKFKSKVFTGKIKSNKIISLQPQTYMNNSGQAVFEAISFYKIAIENVLILHDDVDLEFGRIKFKIGGGNAGHNGLKSIDNLIGKNYKRLRLGVGRPANKEFAVADYVLSKFSKEEQRQLEIMVKNIAKNINLILEDKIDHFNKIVNNATSI